MIIKNITNLTAGATIIVLVLAFTFGEASGQSLGFFNQYQFDTRTTSMGLTGLIDATGPISVLRNPALNRSGKRIVIKPFYQRIENSHYNEIEDIPRRKATSDANQSALSNIEDLNGTAGLTSWYSGAIVQGSGVTIGYIHSDRKEFLYDNSLFTEQYLGRQLESDLFFGGYSARLAERLKIGILLRAFRSVDTGIKTTAAVNLSGLEDVNDFLDEKGSPRYSTSAIDIGGIYVFYLLNRPISLGFSAVNLVEQGTIDDNELSINTGLALYLLRNLLFEFNAVNINDSDDNSEDPDLRFGLEYRFISFRLRAGVTNDGASFGLGFGNDNLSFDYGVIGIDRRNILGFPDTDTIQSLQIGFTGRFY